MDSTDIVVRVLEGRWLKHVTSVHSYLAMSIHKYEVEVVHAGRQTVS